MLFYLFNTQEKIKRYLGYMQGCASLTDLTGLYRALNQFPNARLVNPNPLCLGEITVLPDNLAMKSYKT
eukprot:snap_masked-scaffold_4-processed-gene-0.34-mRNA-1 protein AED:1.00 eAED:1.00 QI:0/0/0/0/1/1/4/0/68